MRSTLYWLTTTALAVLCMSAAATPESPSGVLAETDMALLATSSDPTRSIMLGVGIMAVAYTFQRAWQNFAELKKAD